MCVCADLGVPACLCGLAALRSASYQWALPCNGNATPITQNHELESRPPARHLEKNTKSLSRAGKVHKCTLPAFTCCINHLGKPLLAHFGLFLPFYGSEKTQKLQGAPTKYRQICVKIIQKGGLGAFWTIWRPFLSLLYRFPREYKIKISTDVRSPGAPFGAL